jgi:hypothetical protein
VLNSDKVQGDAGEGHGKVPKCGGGGQLPLAGVLLQECPQG